MPRRVSHVQLDRAVIGRYVPVNERRLECYGMPEGSFVAYYRVSTAKQGASGLGLEAQREAVQRYLNGGDWRIVGEFTEVESGKASKNRPQLQAALQAARLHRATIVVAKLDRLSRNAAFLITLRDSGVRFVAADMPDANNMTVGILALVAEAEREAISQRTRAALQAAKRRGKNLGGDRGQTLTEAHRKAAAEKRAAKATERAGDVGPAIKALQARGVTSLRAIARELTSMGVPTARDGKAWSAVQVQRVLGRLD
jgi:DNA invertase Pin-like site-specific DNA recombinase